MAQVSSRDDTIAFADEVLIARAQRGQMQAFGQLVVKYQDKLYNTALRLTGNQADALDLTQEAFSKAIENLSKFQGRSGFYTWLFRIAVNLAMTRRRVAARRRTYAQSDGPTQAEDLIDQMADSNVATAEQQALRQEQHQQVQTALSKLDENQRAILVLRDVEDFTYIQIAEILDIPINTVRSRLHRARMALREKLLRIL